MTRSELIDLMADGQSQLSATDVERAVKRLIDHMAETLSSGERIEIRGFGSFSLHYREPRQGRNPRTGDTVALRGKHVPHFKPGKSCASGESGSQVRLLTMRWLRQGLTLLLAVGAVAAGGLFSLQNTEEIPLDLIVCNYLRNLSRYGSGGIGRRRCLGLGAGTLLALRRSATIRRLRKQRDRLLAAADKGIGLDSQ